MSAESTFNQLPPVAKIAIVAVGLGATVFIGYKIYEGVKKKVDLKEEKREEKDINKALTDLRLTNIKPTLTDAQLSIIANNIQAAADGYGTNFDAIMNAFSKINNEADQLLLIKKFGIRTISSGKLNPTPNLTGTLGQVLTDELGQSTSQLAAHYLLPGSGFLFKNETDKLNAMLAKKGIKTLF